MTYDQLVMLESIIKCGSFKAASEYLNKSQPSLSVGIKKLEEEFQVKLFNRDEYRPRLTHEGKLFYEKAQLALMHMKSLELFGQELGMDIEQEIKVGIDGLTPLNSILFQLKSFFTDFNNTNLTLLMDHISGTYEKVLNQEIDIGFTPLIEPNEALECLEVFTVDMLPVYSPRMTTKKIQAFDPLKKHPQIIVTDSGKKKDKDYGVLKEARKWIVSDMSSKKQIILNGLGWGRLPSFMIEKELSNKDLLKINLAEVKTIKGKVYMIKNRNKAQGPIAKKLWEIFKNKV